MTKATTRDVVLGRLKDAVKNKKIIVGAGAGMLPLSPIYHITNESIPNQIIGIGLSAKSVEAGGADLIIIYNSGRFRMAGRGSLAGLMPYGDANQVVVEMVHIDSPPTLSTCKYKTNTNIGLRNPPHSKRYRRPRRRLRHRPVPPYSHIPHTTERSRLLRRTKFPHRWTYRRPIPAKSRGNGYGI